MYYLVLLMVAATLTGHMAYAIAAFDERRPVDGHPAFRIHRQKPWGWMAACLAGGCWFAYNYAGAHVRDLETVGNLALVALAVVNAVLLHFWQFRIVVTPQALVGGAWFTTEIPWSEIDGIYVERTRRHFVEFVGRRGNRIWFSDDIEDFETLLLVLEKKLPPGVTYPPELIGYLHPNRAVATHPTRNP